MLNGRTIPEVFYPPEIPSGYETWVDAFWELSTDRALGFGGAGPIPNSAIRAYSSGWPADEREAFRVCIRAMDSVFLQGDKEVIAPPAQEEGVEPDKISNNARDQFRAAFKG